MNNLARVIMTYGEYNILCIFYITQTASYGTHMCSPMPGVYVHLPAARSICGGGGAKSGMAAVIAVFTHVMRGLQSTSLASVALQNIIIIIQSATRFSVRILQTVYRIKRVKYVYMTCARVHNYFL